MQNQAKSIDFFFLFWYSINARSERSVFFARSTDYNRGGERYVESMQRMQQGPEFRQQREPQQPQDEENFQSERTESENRKRRKDWIRLRLRALPQERQSGTRLIEFRELESLPDRGGFLRF